MRRFAVTDLLDITSKVLPVAVVGPGGVGPLPAYTDGHHYYFDDAAVAQAGAHLSGLLDLAGRTVSVERSASGWQEYRGRQERSLHQRHIAGRQVFRFDDEWLFTVVRPGDSVAS
jgi:hypothetical protein